MSAGKFVVGISFIVLVGLCAGMADAGDAGPITPEQAKSIALANTGGGEIMEFDTHYGRKGRNYYRMEILGDSAAFHVEIDMMDGSLLQLVRKHPNRWRKRSGNAAPTIVPDSTPAGDGAVSLEQAAAIALQHSGGGTIVESEVKGKKRGRLVYEFEIINDGVEFEIEIDAAGNLIEYDAKRKRKYAAPLPAAPVASPSPTASGNTARGEIDYQAAREQALKIAGGGSVRNYHLETDGDRDIHSFTIDNEGQRHKVDIRDDGVLVGISVKD